MLKTIYYNFEGFDFEIVIQYHANPAGIFIEDTQLTNMVKQNVCKQEFYHILSVLRYDIANGRHINKIKQKLISELNLEDRVKPVKNCKFVAFIFITMFLISAVVYLITKAIS